ncbi:tetratricopeptide repeat protein [Candidatus Omnitrophota bacterium]
MPKLKTKQKIALTVFGLFLGLVLLEGGLRFGGWIFLSIQEQRNRISLERKGTYRILCLGESTTMGAWPQPLEKILNKQGMGIKFSVIDKGVPGIRTTAIVSQLEDNLNNYNPDMVIAMMGINDGESMSPYKKVFNKKFTLFISKFRVYKLIKLLKSHIINRAQEREVLKGKKKKENVVVNISDLAEPSKKAFEMNPKSEQTDIELGFYYIELGRYSEAEEIFKKTMEFNPKNDRSYVGLGTCYRFTRREAEVKPILKKAIELNPGNEEHYLLIGWSYIQMKKYSEVEDVFKKVIELNSESHEAYYGLGWCLRGQKKYSEAEDMFKRAIELGPSPMKYKALARCYELTGKSNLAKECSMKADILSLDNYDPNVFRSYQRLKEILTKRDIKLVSVQYPMRTVEPLRKMLGDARGIIFVDNERVFKDAVKREGYDEYFVDMFAGDFGHCTAKGNTLLAENIARGILKEVFGK